MRLCELIAGTDSKVLGEELHQRLAPFYPICRSITGDGVRETLRLIGEDLPLVVTEVPSGTPAFDWQVPREWNIRDAWIRGPRGDKVVDFQRSNLHVLGYSAPVHQRLPLAELKPHLHSLPDRPGWIPYRTSYYQERWGFCLSQRQLDGLEEGEYEVCIDATLADGNLTYGECLVAGASSDEVLISCHVCHPSLANDNLSALVVAMRLARELQGVELRYSYRFLFIPGTIGSIVWLSRNQAATKRIKHGLVAAGMGDPGPFHYKRSRRGDAAIDRAAVSVLRASGEPWEALDFVPFGYDERQYGSPGFDLPVGSLTRMPHGRYPEYHTSADDLAFVRPASLGASYLTYLKILHVLESDRRYRNQSPYGEPQLGKRGLYRSLGGGEDGRERELALLWMLNLSDGTHSLLDIVERSGMSALILEGAADQLVECGLLVEEPA